MKKLFSLVALATLVFAGPAFAADPILGTWKLNVAKSKFSPGETLSDATRVYTESDGLYTLEQKETGADGKVVTDRSTYRNGKEETQASRPELVVLATKMNKNIWNFLLRSDGKVVGHVHRVVSADGKTLTVHNTGLLISGNKKGDETLVFDKQ